MSILLGFQIVTILACVMFPIMNSKMSNQGFLKFVILGIYSLLFIILEIIFGTEAIKINIIIQVSILIVSFIRPFIKLDLYQDETDIWIIVDLFSILMLCIELIPKVLNYIA